MTKALFSTALFFCVLITNLSAQSNNPEAVVNQAKRDARHFKLDRTDYKKFLKNKRNIDADYFNPSKTTVRDTLLLSDSTYVKTFRGKAYHKTKSRQINKIMYLVGGSIVAIYVGAVIVALTFYSFPG